jgi:tetratricopeptide (TPR) repeat protein
MRLGLIRHAEGEDSEPRIVRIHRLLQELVRRGLHDDLAARQRTIMGVVGLQAESLKKSGRRVDSRWEVEAFDALAWLWCDTNKSCAAWLLTIAANCWFQLNKWNRAKPLLAEAFKICKSQAAEIPEEFAVALTNFAALLQTTHQYDEAESLYRQALAIEEKMSNCDPVQMARTLDNLGLLLIRSNRLNDAEPLIRRALDILDQNRGPGDLQRADVLNTMAQLLCNQGRADQAEQLERESLAIHGRNLDPTHPTIADDLCTLAVTLRALGRSSEAEQLLRQSLAIDEKNSGSEHPNMGLRLNNLAIAVTQKWVLPKERPESAPVDSKVVLPKVP